MNKNPLLVLESYGQSIWLDYLSRVSLENGEIKRWIDEDGVSGLTSNPSIFEKAIAGSHSYDPAIHSMALEGKSAKDIYQVLTVEDIQNAADIFRPIYDQKDGTDGFVSLEVSPELAHNTAGSITEARRLWKAVGRPNLFIKIPGTREGLPAIRQLIGEGININVTLLFGPPRYREMVDAYLSGLEDLLGNGKPIDRVSSVASFFLSRIDVLVDPLLDKLGSEVSLSLRGQVAIASAKKAGLIHNELFNNERFLKLAGKGARHQRLLWASTSTKNPAYSDVKYIEPLIGPETISTVPVETLNDYREHGKPALSLGDDLQEAEQVLQNLERVGIKLDNVTQQLEDEGVAKFKNAYDQLISVIDQSLIRAQ
jgi:transaldolase